MRSVNNHNFAGLNGFIWWVGEIVNRFDDLGLGRCQVRIYGWYGDDIIDEDLPWAFPMNPINNTRHFEAPSLGEWVVGFFIDGESGQVPIMMGVIPGLKQNNDFE